MVSCFCHLPLFKKEEKEREERISGDIPFRAVVCACESTRCVRVCSERETEREQEGIAGVSATYIPFALWLLVFATFRERTRGNSGCIGDLHTFLRCGFWFLPPSLLQKEEKEIEGQRENKRE